MAAKTSQQFDAVALDQFGLALANQLVSWDVLGDGDGTAEGAGMYRAGSLAGTRESIVATVNGTAVAGSATSHVWSNSTVVGRHLFYNRSKWDGSSTSVPDGENDAAAIADKSALLPQQPATFDNYTSYSKGINGLIVDLADLTPYRVVDLDDFELKVGNSATPSTWAAALPPTITVESDFVAMTARVKFTWLDNQIQNQWLRVTIKTTADTGLRSADVFYFGNLKGETLPNTTTVQSNEVYATLAEDYSATKSAVDASPGAQAPITSIFDHNRDGVLDDADKAVVSQNYFATLYLFGSAPA